MTANNVSLLSGILNECRESERNCFYSVQINGNNIVRHSAFSRWLLIALRRGVHTLLFTPPSFSFQKKCHYEKIAKYIQAGIDNVLWNDDEGIWLDYDTKTEQSRKMFYPSNLSPLYTMSYDWAKRNTYAAKAVSYLERSNISYAGELNGTSSVLINRWQKISPFHFQRRAKKVARVRFPAL